MKIVDDDKEEYTIHFVALFSEKEDAVPIAFFHGWPGSFLEFLPMMSHFKEEYSPKHLPYHIIVPSLPGYTFSSGPPLHRDFDTLDVARLMDRLMIELGFEDGYVVQGGDVGAGVSRVMGDIYPSCKAVHLNFAATAPPEGVPAPSPESYSPQELQGLARSGEFQQTGFAYAMEHGTRPSTIGNVLSTSPVALLAWIGEKFLTWTDEDPSLNVILEAITLYWFTETFPRSIYPYRAFLPGTPSRNLRRYINKPFGFSAFPKEVLPMPKSWIATSGDLVFYREHDKGGHFAALERPVELKKDIEDFVEQVWATAKTG